MKIFKILFLCLSVNTLLAQNVTITPWGITPQQNSAVPRLTYNAILHMIPSEGDMVYDLTFHCLRVYNGQNWVCNNKSNDNSIPNMAIISSGQKGYGAKTGVFNGEIVMAGIFTETISLSNTNNFPIVNLTSSGSTDCYLVKYNNEGQLRWAKKIGGIGYDNLSNIKIDQSGNITIIGSYTGTVDFGGVTKTATGFSNVFVAKYNQSGNLIWVKVLTGSSNILDINGVDYDSQNNVFITGYFLSSVTAEGNTKNAIGGGFDAFYAKYNSDGTLIWIKSFGGNSGDFSNNIKSDENGNIFLTGSFEGTATFGSITKTSLGASDMFIGKVDNNGNFLWVKTAGGSNVDAGRSLAVDISGNIIVGGLFYDNINFEGQISNSLGSSDIFIATYSGDSGTLLWKNTMGGVGLDNISDLIIDDNNKLYLTGSFEVSISLGSYLLSSKGSSDIFISKLDATGKILWAKSFGSYINDEGISIIKDSNGNCFSSGHISASTNFDGINITTNSICMYLLRIEKE